MKTRTIILTIISAGMFAACQQENYKETPALGDVPFELVAKINQLKTTVDNSLNVNWENGDVIYAVTTDETWGKSYTDDNAGSTIAEYTFDGTKFSTTSTIADGTYTFNFAYTNGAQKSYHRGASSTFQISDTQDCDASDPLSAIKTNDALFGQASNVTTPSSDINVTMSHVFTLMKINLNNKSGNDLTIKKFTIKTSTESNIAGIYAINFGGTPSATYSKNGLNEISVSITNGAIGNNAVLPIYFVMACLNGYTGDITFTATDSDDNDYTKTNSVSNLSFAAGTVSSANFTLHTPAPKTSLTWDLSIDETESATESSMTWTGKYASMSVAKASASTATNSYYPGTSGKTYTSTRFYKNSVLTITPASGYQIDSIEFYATSTSYAAALANSTWANADASVNAKNNQQVIVKPTICSTAVSATMGNTFGCSKVVVHFSVETIIPVTGISISKSSTSLCVGEKETISATVSPSNASNKSVIWESDDTNVATVSDGEITAVSAGTAKITATTTDGSFKAECTVTVKAVTTIVLDLTTKSYGATLYNTSTTYGDWIIKNGANNSKGWTYFKMGGKSATISTYNPCSIWYTKQVSGSISKVTVNIVAGSLSKSGMSVNSWGVYVYSDEEMATLVDSVAGGTITSAAQTFEFKPSAGKTWNDCYVKVEWDLANTTSTNGIICVDNVTIYQ